MFPSDNGVFIRKTLSNGIFTSNSSYIIKDNLIFGIRKNTNNITEFWLRFENDVTMTCNYIGEYNSTVYGMDNEVHYDSKNGVYTTLTYPNGLNVQVMADGDICQKNSDLQKSEDQINSKNDESYRVITSKASVIRYFPFDITTVMFSNGNVTNIQNGLSINTNNKGNRVAKRLNDGYNFIMDSIPLTIQSDPESNTKTLIRDDKVINIKYPDKSELTIHADDTKIYTYPDHLKYLIEHNNYASVQIQYDPVKKRTKTCLSESDALLGSDNIMTRSYDGRLSTVMLPDKTIIYTYKEKKATDEVEKYTFNTVLLIYRPDGTIIRIQQDGDICIVTSQERYFLNSKGQNLDVFNDKDVDYLFEINGKPEERKRGSYTVNMVKSKIWTRDDEDNIFEIHADGTSKCKIKVTFDLQNSGVPIEDMRPVTPTYDTPDYIDEEAKFSDCPSNFFIPRLFVINNDNTGYELLSEKQISNFKIIKEKDKAHSKYYTTPIEDNFISHYWLTKYYSVCELIAETHKINNIRIPKKLEKITQTPVTLTFPKNEIYLYRSLIESQEINQEFREKIALSIQNKDKWFFNKKNEFGTVDKNANKEEIEENSKIQRRILNERQNPDHSMDYNEIQNNLDNIIIGEIINELNIKKSIIFDIQEYCDEKERKKLVENMNFRILPIKYNSNINITEVLAAILESSFNSKTNMGMRRKTIDTKAVQEIKFIKDFYKSDWAKTNLLSVGSIRVVKSEDKNSPQKSKSNNNKNNRDQQNYNSNDDLIENEDNPYGLEAILNSLQIKSAYNNDDNLNYDPKSMSPIVYLENEKLSETKKSPKPIKKMLPSIYRMGLQKMKEMEKKDLKDAEDWTNCKSYQYNHDGKTIRGDNPLLPKYLKTTFPEAEFNENYIYVEKLTDHRLKTSSVSNRLYFNAPTINEIRKSGQHNFLLEALEKKKTYEEMMERLNLMITSELCDPLNKMLKIDPIILDFGYLKADHKYEMFFRIRNDDNLTNKVQIRKDLDSKFINIENFIAGKVLKNIILDNPWREKENKSDP
jgi:hypothetical protein